MAIPWCRLWADTVDDDKIRLLGFDDRWHFIAILCLKAQGVLDERDETLRRQKISVKLGLDSVELETAMKRLVTVGLLTAAWHPKKWGKRQFQSDSSTSRVRAFRKRFSSVSETDQKQIQKQNTDKNPLSPKGAVEEVFEHWRQVHGHPNAVLDSIRRKAIEKQLKQYTAEQLREAIDGYKLSDFHQGKNDGGKVYDALTLILRSADQVERGIQLKQTGKVARWV